MTNYTGSTSGPLNSLVPLLDTTDQAMGGSSGNMNAATKKLADNDAYLYNIMGGFENIVTLAVSGGTSQTLTTANLLRNLVVLNHDTDNYFSAALPQCSTYKNGALAVLKRSTASTAKPTTITCHSGDTFTDRTGAAPTSIYLHNNEMVTLMNTGTAWIILRFEGGHYSVGDQMFGYAVKNGTLKRDGSVYNRADYPRLWAWVLANSLYTDDSTWSSHPGSIAAYPYKSLFSSGDGSTTFRMPDDRAQFDRAMDLGAGIDTDRVSASLGSAVATREDAAFASHTHLISQTPHNHGISDPGHTHSVGLARFALQSSGATNTNNLNDGHGSDDVFSTGSANTGISVNNASITMSNQNTGGNETRPVNVAKYPLIVY